MVEQPRVAELRETAAVTSQDGGTNYRAQLRVNAKGCGYPPSGKSSTWKNIFIISFFLNQNSVNCSEWIKEFGKLDSTFNCHFSQ